MIGAILAGLIGAIAHRFSGDDDNVVLRGRVEKKLMWMFVYVLAACVVNNAVPFAWAGLVICLHTIVVGFFTAMWMPRKPWQDMEQVSDIALGAFWGFAELLFLLTPFLWTCDSSILWFAIFGALQGPIYKLSYKVPLIPKPQWLRDFFDWHTAYGEFAMGFVFLVTVALVR